MIQGIGRFLCMMDQSEEVKVEEITPRMRSKDRKKSKAPPDLKYNKFEAAPINNQFFYNDRPTANSNHDSKANSTQALYQQQTPTHLQQQKNASLAQADGRVASALSGSTIESDGREIKRILKIYINRMNEKDAHNRVVKEWRIVARVLDRIFFFLYVATIIVSLATIFPKG